MGGPAPYDPYTSNPVKNNKTELLRIYPNPASTYINLFHNNLPQGIYTLNFIDITGKVVAQKSIYCANGRENLIDISGLNKGIYFIQLNGQSNTIPVSILKLGRYAEQ